MNEKIKEAKKKVKTFVDNYQDEIICVGGVAVGILALRVAFKVVGKNNVATDKPATKTKVEGRTSGRYPWGCNNDNKQRIDEDIFTNIACRIEDAVFDDNVTNFEYEQLYDVKNEGVSGKLVTVRVEDYTF